MLVSTNNLTKRYGAFTALDHCTCSVTPGEVFGLLGPNGAGKTTLLRLLLGFLKPTKGLATVDGLDCSRESVAVRSRIAYLPGDARLVRHMKGRDVLRFFARVRREGDLRRAFEIADDLELDLAQYVAFMSTGMRQKLALAATFSMNTPLLILDEPTANLDPTVRSTVLQLVRTAKQEGKTVIFSSHVLSEIEEICDRVVILRAGQLVHLQVMAELKRQHRIHARLHDAMPAVPDDLVNLISFEQQENGEIEFHSPGELTVLLGWLSTLPLAEMSVSPIGLRAVYDQFHHHSAAATANP